VSPDATTHARLLVFRSSQPWVALWRVLEVHPPPLTFEQVACMDDSPLPAQGSILGGSSPSEAFRFCVGQLRVEKASHIGGVV